MESISEVLAMVAKFNWVLALLISAVVAGTILAIASSLDWLIRAGPGRKRIVCGTLLVAAVGTFGGTSWVLRNTVASRPQLSGLPETLIGDTLHVDWTHRWDNSESPYYRLRVKNGTKPDRYSDLWTSPPIWMPTEGLRGACKIALEVVMARRSGAGLAVEEVITESEEVQIDVFPSTVERIKAKQEVRFAIHMDSSSAGFCYPAADPNGFDPDYARYVAKELQTKLGLEKLDVRLRHYSWPEVYRAPRDGRADIALASVSATDSRRNEGIMFTAPYMVDIKLGVMVSRARKAEFIDHDGTVHLQGLSGMNVGVHAATTAVDFMRDAIVPLVSGGAPRIHEAANNNVLFSRLLDGAGQRSDGYDCIVYDAVRAVAEAKRRGPWDVVLFNYDDERLSSIIKPDQYAMVIADGDMKAMLDPIIGSSDRIVTELRRKHRIEN